MIGSLLYLMASKLDIMFSVRLCARFQSYPKEYHLIMVKHIIRFLKALLQWAYGIRKSDNFP